MNHTRLNKEPLQKKIIHVLKYFSVFKDRIYFFILWIEIKNLIYKSETFILIKENLIKSSYFAVFFVKKKI